MDRVSEAEGEAGTRSELVRSVEPLSSAPASFVGGDRQRAFDAAHQLGVQSARTELGKRLSLDFDAAVDPEVDVEVSLGFVDLATSFDAVLSSLVDAAERRAVEHTSGSGPTLAFVAGEHVRTPTADDEASHRLVSALNDGWMAMVLRPRRLGRSSERLFADLAYAFGGATPMLQVGMRTALGPPFGVRDIAVLVLQMLGTRSLSVHGPDRAPVQRQVVAGSALLVPPGRSVVHLPLDMDTVHVEVELRTGASGGDGAEAARERDAMLPVVVVADHDAARAVVDEVEQGRPMRLRAAGGAHIIEEEAALLGEAGKSLVIAVGGMRLEVSDLGADLVEHLLRGTYISPDDAAELLSVETNEVIDAMRRLWDAGLLEAAPTAEPERANDRVTQVASAGLGAETTAPFIAAIDPAGWRPPEVGEVPVDAPVDLSVQPLDLDRVPITGVVDVVRGLNARFLRVELRPEMAEPVLAVRVLPGTQGETPGAAVETASVVTGALMSDLVGASTRKLTFVLSLTDPDGGWVHLPGGSDTADATVGSLSTWASFRPWTLRPLPSGERLFLLGRLHGPSFT